jgi:hypothetical protein
MAININTSTLTNRHPIHNLRHFDIALLEAIFLPIVVPVLIWLSGRQDVFFLHTAFPWIILIPTLTATRYGTWYGLLSLSIFSVLCLFYVSQFQPDFIQNAIQILVASLLLVILTGEITERWKKQSHQQIQKLKDCRQSTNQSEQALQLLHISYSQLEEEMVTTTQSLAGSLRLLEVSLEQPNTRKDRLLLAISKMHTILQQYEWLEAAAFYHINIRGKIKSTPLGAIGVMPNKLHKDPLLLEVIKSKRSIKINQKLAHSELEAAIPMIDNNGHLWGVLAIHRITPSASIQQNLNLLALLCGYVANLLSHAQQPILGSTRLFNEISTSVEVVLNTVKSVTIMNIEIPASANPQEYQLFFSSKIRGANRIWRLKNTYGINLIILLPLFNADNALQWLQNLESTFNKQFGVTFSKAKIKFKPLHLHKTSNVSSLQKHLNTIHEFKHAHLIR